MFEVGKKFKIIGDTYYDHEFEIGEIVEVVKDYSNKEQPSVDVRGFLLGYGLLKLHVHPTELEAVE